MSKPPTGSNDPDGRGGRAIPWRWRGWIERLSLTSGPDVLGLLVTQGEVSVEALEAFEAWSDGGDHDGARKVNDLEQAADDARHALVAALRTSLATPIGQEDLFTLSERCDRVVNRAKNIIIEAEALGWTPNAHAARMAVELHSGMVAILAGFMALTSRSDATAEAAVTATHCVRGVEHAYREAMIELAHQADVGEVFTGREILRSYARAGEALEALADRLWYAVLAEP